MHNQLKIRYYVKTQVNDYSQGTEVCNCYGSLEMSASLETDIFVLASVYIPGK